MGFNAPIPALEAPFLAWPWEVDPVLLHGVSRIPCAVQTSSNNLQV